jgi:hypothetical protein
VQAEPPDAETREAPPDRRFPPLDRSAWRRWRNAVNAFATSEAGGRAKAPTAVLLLVRLAIGRLRGAANGLAVELG